MPRYVFLLYPLALLVDFLTRIRNLCYDWGIFRSEKSPISTLVVGNISVGGSGKTPHVEWLIEKLRSEYKLGVLSRGYGRQTSGFFKADRNSTPEKIGDEPHQIFSRFIQEIPVFVGENRVEALNQIHSREKDLDLIVLDDAFQHRRLKGDFYILLTPYQAPFFKDFLMPVGRLRENRTNGRRADAIVVTKCPQDISAKDQESFRRAIQGYAGQKPIFFSKLSYGAPYLVSSSVKIFTREVILVSALADDRLFKEYAEENFNVLEAIHFRDHYNYTSLDASRIKQLAEKHSSRKPVILTTEKDAQKLKSLADQGFFGDFPIFALPIQVKFESKEEETLLCSIRLQLKST